MTRNILTLLLQLFTIIVVAQRATPDQFQTSSGTLTVQPILHGTVVLNWNHKSIYVDPYGGAKVFEGITPPDLVLITDIHGDHLNAETLKDLDLNKSILVVPKAVADQLPDNLKSKAVVLDNGKSTLQLGISITAIPMYNLPEAADSRHAKGRGNGYILDLGGKLVYLSGDTEDIPEMRSLKNIDIAFVCMNQPYTMDINQASDAVLAFRPKVVYPYHYRGQGGLSDIDSFKKLVNAGDPAIDVRLRNWYP
jgi:L-ascorbate metabolism protein UlaG (beta-lactamase superfamily)